MIAVRETVSMAIPACGSEAKRKAVEGHSEVVVDMMPFMKGGSGAFHGDSGWEIIPDR